MLFVKILIDSNICTVFFITRTRQANDIARLSILEFCITGHRAIHRNKIMQ